jgi:hypothetical protein
VQRSGLLSPKNGARLKSAPLFTWRATTGALFYNLQVYRNGHKILSVWPRRARFKMSKRWKFSRRAYRLRRATYTWIVWPAFGVQAKPRYGKALGQRSFRYIGK